jgi:hypothetical protein
MKTNTERNELPILLSTEMVQAVVAGRKTMTRRIVKGHALNWIERDGFTPEFVSDPKNYLSPFGYPGDLLWVRETWGAEQLPQPPEGDWDKIIYRWKASEEPDPASRWKPSIHMPKEAARIWLQIGSLHIEKLQDISESDAVMEGVEMDGMNWFRDYQINDTAIPFQFMDARQSFRSLWSSIYGGVNWNKNPWVWVVEFKVLSTTGKPVMEHTVEIPATE